MRKYLPVPFYLPVILLMILFTPLRSQQKFGMTVKRPEHRAFRIDSLDAARRYLSTQSDLSMHQLAELPALARPDSQPGRLSYLMPLLKYDTSPANPEHRCYDFRKTIAKNYTFVFNFLSSAKYNIP